MNDAKRDELAIDGRRLSYLDFGGPGRTVVALHGHLSEGAVWGRLAAELAGQWRVVAPDQRGQGESERAGDYTRAGYLADVEALLDHLGLEKAVLLGHSLGGINAYQFAARQPERVEAVIDVEAPVVLGLDGPNPLAFLLGLPYEAPSREELVAALGPAAPYFADRLRRNADGGWRLPFHPKDMYDSEELVHGDHWADWTASGCPALVVRGTEGVVPAGQAAEMAARRPGTVLVELAGDHLLPVTAADELARTVRGFLAAL
ncbi:alpha/beta fold hydrolase [Kitasatospora sp. NPDC092039]|uniref:alpha/beta fold hydrolase n=1 Tax=Kitasatospora sp. NPDC092039 TaxID=3364086 RepID=UPI0037F32034